MQQDNINSYAIHWCMTINNPTAMDDAQLTLFIPLCDYIVIGKEHWNEPVDLTMEEPLTPHYQIYFALKKKMRFSGLKKLFPRAHIEPKVKHSTCQEAAEYCKKEGNFVEHGEVPKEKTQAATEKAKDIWDTTKYQAKKGLLDEINSEIYIKHYGTLKKIAEDERIKKMPAHLEATKIPPNYWFYGPTGTGKSHRARRANANDVEEEEFYYKMNNQWWEGYDNQENVIIEDVGMTHLWMGDHLKIWADRYAFRARVLYGSNVLRPKKITVTSNYHPRDLWPDPNVWEPIARRFVIINMNVPWNAQLGVVQVERETGRVEEMEVMGTCHVDDTGACHPKTVQRPVMERQNALGAITPTLAPAHTILGYNNYKVYMIEHGREDEILPFDEWDGPISDEESHLMYSTEK